MGFTGSTVPRRQLGRFLRQLRCECNLSVLRVCSELECSPQKIWRIEVGLARVKVADVKVLSEVYQATAEVTELLVNLARQGSPGGWWGRDHGVPEESDPYLVLESSAARLRHYDPTWLI